MQTFLPYPDFAESARVLDRQRLGKQRVEVLQLLRAILVPGSGWENHPAANMWRGYEMSLRNYGMTICDEWFRRGYKDTCKLKLAHMVLPIHDRVPHWLGDPAFHAAHRSNLLRKDPTHYGRFGWAEPNDLPYLWPV